MEQDNFERLAPKDMRPKMAEWAVQSWGRVMKDTVYNSWRHAPFSYFPNEPTRAVEFQDDDFDYSSSEEEDEPEYYSDEENGDNERIGLPKDGDDNEEDTPTNNNADDCNDNGNDIVPLNEDVEPVSV